MNTIPPKPDHIQATPGQWQAIMQRGNNLLVSASAGSGKTKVLVERIFSYIDEGVNIDRLLIVTFTEAAAREMKERLRSSLEKAIMKETDAVKKRRYLEQITLLPNATISTIHSFCMKVIRRYFYLTNMDPVFGMLDEVEGALLREKVWRSLQDRLLEETTWMRELMRYFSTDRSDDTFTTLVYQLYDFARSKPHPKQWLAELSQLYTVNNSLEELAVVREQFIPLMTNELTAYLDRYDELLQQSELVGFDGAYQTIESDISKVQDIVSAFASGNYTAAYQLAQEMSFVRWKSPKKNDEEVDKEAVKALQNRRDALKDTWNKQLFPTIFFQSPDEQVQQLHALAPIVAHLSDVVLAFYTAFQEEKKRSNQIDFSDLEHDTLEILHTTHQGERIAALHYQEQFVEVLVDEYQDVNSVQEAILTSVCRGDNLFMVGDVKQSIYAFRLADPSLFREKYERFATGDGGERIVLAENFRSRDQVLAFTNLIFKQIMNPELGQIDYDDAAALKTGNDSYSTDDTDKNSELYIIEKKASEETTEADELEMDDTSMIDTAADAEIHLIASKIKEMMTTNFSVMAADSTKTAIKKRPLRYKDIVILAPTKGHNTRIEEIFAQYQIPVFVQKNNMYFRRTEIAIMMAALKIIDNPTQDIPFVAVLRSGMVGLDEVQLAHIRKGKQHMPFVDACRKFVREFRLEDVSYMDSKQQEELRQKIAHFLELLTKWRNMANQYSLSELIWTIYLDTNYLAYVHGQSVGSQRVLNLHALYHRAKDYEASSFKGLRNFVRFIQTMQQRKQDLEEPTELSDEEDAVRVMTIHASKGLEFPVVFLMDAGKRFNLKDLSQSAIRSDAIGLGLTHMDIDHRIQTPTIPYIVTKQTELNKLLSEEMRKLYVALTRAREKLIIVGSTNNVEQFESTREHIYLTEGDVLPYLDRNRARSYLDWLLLATMREQNTVPFEKHLLTQEAIEQQALQWTIQQEQTALTEEEWLQSMTKNRELPDLKDLLQQLKQPYRHQLASNTASYQSVSEIKRMIEEPDVRELPHLEASEQTALTQYIYLAPELEKPQFLQTTKTVSAAKRGSGLHLLMQKIDLSQPITLEIIEQTVERLVATQFLEREVADVLPLTQVLAFFESEFGQWLLTKQPYLKREQAFSYVVPATTVFNQLEDDHDSLLIHGIIDGYVELDDQVIVFDYKTDHVVPTKEGIQKIVSRYKGQLDLYAKALESSTGKPVTRKMLCLLSINENIRI